MYMISQEEISNIYVFYVYFVSCLQIRINDAVVYVDKMINML